MAPTQLLYWAAQAGVALYAITGAQEAGRKGMDVVGACAIGLATAAGGGTIRDILMGQRVFWIVDPSYMIVSLVAALVAFFVWRATNLPVRLFMILDAIGLALFTVSGTQIALAGDTSWLAAGFLGVVTGAAGGVLRDILCNEVPIIFLPGELYAIAAAAGAAAIVVMHACGLDHTVAAILGFLVALILRLAAITFKLRSTRWTRSNNL